MGLMQSITTAVAQHRSNGDVKEQVKAMFDEALTGLKRDATAVDPKLKRFIGVQAGQVTEDALLENAEFILDQLQADGRRAEPAEVRTAIIETVRDLKMTSIEQDGNVNPFDAMAIQLKAGGLKGKVRQQFLGARSLVMKGSETSDQLDYVESKLLVEAIQKFGRNYDELQREAQAIIYAVAELRLQQLVGR
ncbi:MAG TPA: hypothetical protein VMU12_00295 [Candidatus Paceibacterota bacterium]|nr:hypothetical protein [Candidatus Paceibacterota bacterium]